jgi:hypothetical protein
LTKAINPRRRPAPLDPRTWEGNFLREGVVAKNQKISTDRGKIGEGDEEKGE